MVPDHQAQELPVQALPHTRPSASSTNLTTSLAAVNFFLGLVGLVQISRIAMYESEKKKNGGLVEDVKQEVAEVKEEIKEKIKN